MAKQFLENGFPEMDEDRSTREYTIIAKIVARTSNCNDDDFRDQIRCTFAIENLCENTSEKPFVQYSVEVEDSPEELAKPQIGNSRRRKKND